MFGLPYDDLIYIVVVVAIAMILMAIVASVGTFMIIKRSVPRVVVPKAPKVEDMNDIARRFQSSKHLMDFMNKTD